MPRIYCGNNALDSKLVSGRAVLGTRYTCMRNGIGRGLHMPKDPSYSGDYMPIDERKIYCGDQQVLPQSYDSFGNLPSCLQKGIGIGKRKVAMSGFTGVYTYTAMIYILSYLLIITSVFLYLYFGKPSIVSVRDQADGRRRVKWSKFMIFYLPFGVVLGLIMYFMYVYI